MTKTFANYLATKKLLKKYFLIVFIYKDFKTLKLPNMIKFKWSS